MAGGGFDEKVIVLYETMIGGVNKFKLFTTQIDSAKAKITNFNREVTHTKISTNHFHKGIIQQQSDLAAWSKKMKMSLEMTSLAKRTFQKLFPDTGEERRMQSLIGEKKVNDIIQKQKELGAWSKEMKKNLEGIGFDRLVKDSDSFRGVMGASLPTFKKFVKHGAQFNTVGGKMAFGFRRLSHGARGFRMELLGVMFFGQMVTRTMMGLLNPAMGLVGIFDLWAITLQMLFLPVAMWLLDKFMIPLVNWISGLSEEVKLCIGQMVLFAGVFGIILGAAGALLLGLGSFILFIGVLASTVGLILAPFTAFAGIISLVIGALIGIVVAAVAWGSFKSVVIGIMDKLLEIKGVKDLFEKFGVEIDDTKTSLENFKNLAEEMLDSFAEKLGLEDGWQTFKDNYKLYLGGFIDKIKMVISLLDRVFQLIQDIFFSEIETMPLPGGGTLSLPPPSLDFDMPDDIMPLPFGPQPKKDDFIWRPGQGAISINPNDTLVGFKGKAPGMGEIIINQTLNITGSMVSEIERMIDGNNRKLVDDLRRMVHQ